MASSLSNPVNILAKRIHKIQFETCEFCLEYTKVINDLIE